MTRPQSSLQCRQQQAEPHSTLYWGKGGRVPKSGGLLQANVPRPRLACMAGESAGAASCFATVQQSSSWTMHTVLRTTWLNMKTRKKTMHVNRKKAETEHAFEPGKKIPCLKVAETAWANRFIAIQYYHTGLKTCEINITVTKTWSSRPGASRNTHNTRQVSKASNRIRANSILPTNTKKKPSIKYGYAKPLLHDARETKTANQFRLLSKKADAAPRWHGTALRHDTALTICHFFLEAIGAPWKWAGVGLTDGVL